MTRRSAATTTTATMAATATGARATGTITATTAIVATAATIWCFVGHRVAELLQNRAVLELMRLAVRVLATMQRAGSLKLKHCMDALVHKVLFVEPGIARPMTTRASNVIPGRDSLPCPRAMLLCDDLVLIEGDLFVIFLKRGEPLKELLVHHLGDVGGPCHECVVHQPKANEVNSPKQPKVEDGVIKCVARFCELLIYQPNVGRIYEARVSEGFWKIMIHSTKSWMSVMAVSGMYQRWRSSMSLMPLLQNSMLSQYGRAASSERQESVPM